MKAFLATAFAGAALALHAADSHAFTFGGPDNSEFLLDGKPFQIRAGEVDPGRVPHEYWRHSIQMPDGAADWNLLAEFPRQEAYAGAPATVRIGKIGNTWQAQDYPQRGTSNTCCVDWVRIY